MTFHNNDISENINLLQELAVTIAKQQNDHVDEFNAAVDEIELLRSQVEKLQAELEDQKQLNQSIHKDRLAIIEKNNQEVTKANATIRKLQTEAADYRVKYEELLRLDPKRLERLLAASKKTNEELRAANDRLTAKNKELTNFNNKLRKDISIYNEGVWSHGQEKIIPFNGEVMGITDDERKPVDGCVWWHHERGVRLLCGYNYESDRIVICDPVDEETGFIFSPSALAEKNMKEFFKHYRAEKERQDKAKQKKAA